MSEKEYIVSLKRDVDASNFKAEMTQSSGDTNIPNRSVDVANERLLSTRNTHYSLTDEEATQLKNDSRVADVHIPPEDDDTLEIGLHATQTADFTKTTSDSGDYVNWGLRRCITNSNPYSGNTVSGDYTYNLDGTGVDVVIQDSGLQVDHPEFNDASGTSRVQQINWYTESGLSGTQSSNHYRDYNGHGTHVGGTAAGLTYGWAKNARVYAVKVSGLEGTGDSGGIGVSNCFDVIKGWHNNKGVDPATGYKRPTIVNMSWGYGTYSYNVTSINYRGSTYGGWTGTGRNTTYGIVGSYRSATYGYRMGTRITSVDTDIQEMIDAGIHVCIAAGNYYQKIDVPSGTDYNNYFVSSSYGTKYYNRGSSPFDDEALMVGNMDSTVHSGGLEQKASSSENGPGVDIYAPGTNVMSTCSTINEMTNGDYPPNSSYKICNISGTSMASPQVCGVGALLLQANPHSTPAQLKAQLIATCQTNAIYSTGLDNDYANSRSIKGGNNRFLVNPFASEYKYRIQNT
tara:strand:- start:6601 stop:8142 length:1542 start_codon:yes stop_codon:yes gene_type:complete